MGGGLMISLFKLLLPALIPSWNFFDEIGASPRIEYNVQRSPDEADGAWRAFRPRPPRVPVLTMFARLLWNARWNETLFVASCAERLLAAPTAHGQDEIFRRIAADLPGEGAWLRFRIFLLSEVAGAVVQELAFISAPRRIEGGRVEGTRAA